MSRDKKLTGTELLGELRKHPQYEGMSDYYIKKTLGKGGKPARVSDLKKEYDNLEEVSELSWSPKKKTSRCWAGYEPVPGKKPYSKGSCRKSR